MPSGLRKASGVSDVYRSCMQALNDGEYCSGVVDAVVHTLTNRVFRYVPEGRKRPIRYLVLSPNVEYVQGTYVDENKQSVVTTLRAENHMVYLIYKKDSDGRFVLRNALVHTIQNEAMLNGPLIPKDALSEGDYVGS
jgi:hypothetical protein